MRTETEELLWQERRRAAGIDRALEETRAELARVLAQAEADQRKCAAEMELEAQEESKARILIEAAERRAGAAQAQADEAAAVGDEHRRVAMADRKLRENADLQAKELQVECKQAMDELSAAKERRKSDNPTVSVLVPRGVTRLNLGDLNDDEGDEGDVGTSSNLLDPSKARMLRIPGQQQQLPRGNTSTLNQAASHASRSASKVLSFASNMFGGGSRAASKSSNDDNPPAAEPEPSMTSSVLLDGPTKVRIFARQPSKSEPDFDDGAASMPLGISQSMASEVSSRTSRPFSAR